jgi:hypothetical protein
MAMTDRTLRVIEQAPAPAGACCQACEAAELAAAAAGTSAARPAAARPVVAPAPLPVILPTRRGIDRGDDRRVTVAGLVVAGVFVAAAAVTALAGPTPVSAPWLPLHLALAGGASTAIAAVLPFFTAALAVARPVDARWRALAVAAVAVGAAGLAASMALATPFLAHVAGTAYVSGIGLVAVVAFAPLRGALGPRRPLVEGAYALALAMIATSAVLAIAFLAGTMAIVERWAVLKPLHAWLNLFGFVSLIVVATLVHLAPTVEGTRIRPRLTARLAVSGLALGVPLIALGYLTGLDPVGRLGAVAVIVAAIAAPAHAVAVWRDRTGWTGDHAWHRMAAGSLRAATGWYAVAAIVAAGRVLWLGPVPAAWDLELIAVPFVVGWVVQAIIGAWTQLLPAIGTTDRQQQERARSSLGQGATVRLVAFQLGVAAVWVGTLVDLDGVIRLGGAVLVATLAIALGLAFLAVRPASSVPRRIETQYH